MEAHAPGRDVSAEVAARLREAITSGRFMPNERLVEADLVTFLDANRANVRMALAMLDQEGLVVREPNRGARVRLLSDVEAIEIAEARRAIETMVARQAAERAGDDDRSVLQGIITDMKAAVAASDPVTYSRLNARLHREIQRIAANATASRLLQTLRSQLVRLQYQIALFPGRPAQSVVEHANIVAAICAGDGAAAEAAMRTHLDQVVANIRSAVTAARAGML
ncbi:GntR family transcriptional regulator [Xanthobacteraceae bacterium Astr-EGSB]|uniref:GntR family transcriptional regulator n=1 Tax=Astrobacterium formosum TaxID=3069710 RepID=UPI0027B64332|nr:GntR family transcriptional regulator [Xanthobacteraceae bacterium Astr-EGSB]